METNQETKLDFGALDFTPAWAKQNAGVTIGKVRPERESREGERRNFGERKGFGGERKPFVKKPFGERKAFARPERVLPLDAEVKILPDSKALGGIIRKLQSDQRAYKLKDLAYFFLDNPASVLLRISPRSEKRFYQCKACGFAAFDEAAVIDHIVSAHLGDYFDTKEVEVEPPKGNFTSVVRCGLSGVLLGPPNLHEFNTVVKEMLRTRYPDMREEDYRARFETVREPEVIEEWRKGATKKTMYFAKGTAGEEGASALDRAAAEGELKRNFLPSLLASTKTLLINADKALVAPDRSLVYAVRDALEAERRTPQAMCFALRGAFHHRKLNFFRTNDARGQEFVTSAELKEFDAVHAIDELKTIAAFIADHPCSYKQEIAKTPDEERALQWLVSTGHIVAFTNGVYSPVEKFPKYGPQWRKEVEGGESKSKVEVEGGETKVEVEVEEKTEVKDENTAQLAE